MSTRVTDVAISKQLDAGEVPDELVAAYQETQQHAELPGAVADRVPSSMELATMYATGKASYNFPFIPAPPGPPQDAVVVNVEAKASSSPAPLLSPPLERQDSLLDFLDSQDSTLDDIMTWDEAKRQRFVEGLSPEWLPKLIAKARKAGWLESPVDVTFRNLFYQKNGVTLVNGVSGYVKRGTMVAVIGEGATDLFEVITGHARGGIISGEMLVNGKPPDEAYKRLIGFVSKDDVHLPTLTVRETLRFSSMLRSKPELPDVGKLFRCELVMKTLGLQHCAESIVGDGILRGISGGEKRRLSVAVELVAGHSLIVADLPTNGLDSASAMRLVTNVRNATKAGASQIMSLAQPSPELLNMFDSVILLSRGTVIFQGPPNEAESYFAGLGFYRPKDKAVPDFLEELCKQPQKFYLAAPDEVILSPAVQRKQPVEVAIEEAKEVGAALPERSVMSGTTLKDSWHLLVQSYKKSKMYADLGHVLWTELEPVFDYRSTKAARPKEFQTSLLVQTIMCLVRQWRITIRNKAVSTGGILRAIFMGLLVGTVFYKMGDSQSDARARIGMLFYVLAFAGMSPMQTVPAFIEQRTVYYSQQKSGYFRGLAYFISYTLTSVPFVLIELFIYSLFVYGMAGLSGGVGSEQFWYFWLTLVMMSLVSRAFCLFTASLSPNGIVASALPPVALVLFIIFCGYLMPKESIPSGWIWLYYISFFTYGIKGLAINEYFSLTFSCASSDRVPLTSNPLYSIAPPVGFGFTIPDQGTCPVSTGHDMLARYGMDTSDEFEKWNLWFRLIIFYVCFNAAAAVVLVFIDWSGETTVEPLPVGDPDTLDPNTPYIPRQNSELRKAERKETASYVEFNNLQYSVDVPSKEKRAPPFCMKRKTVEKTLLNNVFGYAEPGKMIALMGASGAGKSTLLDVLANKKTGGHIKGKLLFNGKPRDEYFSRWAGYVEQFDSHFETATVREAIEFSASLRLPSDISKADKDRRVRRVMEQLELTNVANERIGNVASGGLSPELRKKVTIAVELVMDPGMLFLDEPTTGLGSAAAVEVMNVVRKLADEISVMCTIHQPSEEIVKLFDWLLLLQPGGTVVYFGPVSEVAAYFKSQGLGEIQPGQNVADFALQVIGNRSLDRKKDPSIPDPAALFLEVPVSLIRRTCCAAQSEQGKQVKAKLEQPTIVPQGQTFRSFSSPQASGFFLQFLVTLKRFFEMQARQPSTLMVRGGTSTIMALVIGTLFYQLPLDQAGANNRVAMIYLALMLTNFTASSAIHAVIDQRPVYFRENTSNMYSFFAFWLSRLLSDMPFIIVQNFVFSVITYWMAGFTDAESGAHFGRYYAMMLIGAFMAYAFSELCATVAPDAELANVLNTLVLTIMMLFAGFLVQKSSIPDPWIFMYYINFFRYPLFFLMSNEIADLTFSCPGNTGAVYAAVNQTYCVSHSLTDPLCYKIQCPITQGKQTLEQFSVDYSELSLYFGATVVIWVGLRLLGLLGFRFINHIKR